MQTSRPCTGGIEDVPLDNLRYPTTEQGLTEALVTKKPTTGPAANGYKPEGYILKLPKDPWGQSIPVHVTRPQSRSGDLLYGQDGQPAANRGTMQTLVHGTYSSLRFDSM